MGKSRVVIIQQRWTVHIAVGTCSVRICYRKFPQDSSDTACTDRAIGLPVVSNCLAYLRSEYVTFIEPPNMWLRIACRTKTVSYTVLGNRWRRRLASVEELQHVRQSGANCRSQQFIDRTINKRHRRLQCVNIGWTMSVQQQGRYVRTLNLNETIMICVHCHCHNLMRLTLQVR